jgi:hypothetical protein
MFGGWLRGQRHGGQRGKRLSAVHPSIIDVGKGKIRFNARFEG